MNKTPMKSFEIIKEMYEYFVKNYRDLEPKLMICEKEDFDIIEKAFKALEIIKERVLEIDDYNGIIRCKDQIMLTIKEYELLKEILK